MKRLAVTVVPAGTLQDVALVSTVPCGTPVVAGVGKPDAGGGVVGGGVVGGGVVGAGVVGAGVVGFGDGLSEVDGEGTGAQLHSTLPGVGAVGTAVGPSHPKLHSCPWESLTVPVHAAAESTSARLDSTAKSLYRIATD